VFVTVGSIEKRNFVHDHYSVPLDPVLSSRDLNFVHGINRLAKGYSVDTILSFTSGQNLRASWEIIASYGRFIEIGKVDIFSNAALPRGSFRIMQSDSHTGKLVLKSQQDDLVMGSPYPIHGLRKTYWDNSNVR
jgi:NADPH:quinone reductase-like Zn-dependent oxidoreductase